MVALLVADFEANEKHYLSSVYKEAEVRKDFIDKFLIALGWDVNHDVQKNPLQQEVKVERQVQIATAQKRADYSLSLSPHFDTPVLYVEAKKPSGDIATSDNYFQTIRYGYQKSHAIGILTDFEQLQIVDCRYKPNIDTALARSIRKYHYSDFRKPECFAEIYYLLARPCVLDGSLLAYAAKLPKPKGRPGQKSFLSAAYKPVDEALLEELDDYRRVLARALKNRNPDLDAAELTELTQRILDRLVFIRFLEDKLIEPDHLISAFGEGSTSPAWRDFIAASRRLDKLYNGVVFKQHPRLDAPPTDPKALAIDDKHFADLLDAFDHTRSPYLFNEIPIHILGSIYERFLGNVITTTAKRADLDPKPEVRKAGGVFYTPQHIVEYIVEKTVGKLIEGKTPADISNMRFADIACGSGSFLLGVYDCLLKYHRAWYNKSPSKAPKGAVVKKTGTNGVPAYYLSLEEKSRILTNNIYGVDIDPQAVEVAQLSLYLKLLEDETTASARQFTMDFHRPLLPSLGNNIKYGNSLIEEDYYTQAELFERDQATLARVKPFSWQREFPAIHAAGGFDAVVGNPPYIDSEWMTKHLPETRHYCTSSGKYKSASGNWDMFCVFVERAIQLCKRGGLTSMIVPNKLGSAEYGSGARTVLAHDNTLRSIRDYSAVKVFPVAVYPIVYIAEKTLPQPSSDYFVLCFMKDRGAQPPTVEEEHKLPYAQYLVDHASPWRIFSRSGDPSNASSFREKMRNLPQLSTVATVLGAATVAEAYELCSLLTDSRTVKNGDLRLVNSGTIDRYCFLWGRCPTRYIKVSFDAPDVPLASLKRLPPKRLAQSRSRKIIISCMTKRLECSLDLSGGYIAGKSTTIVLSEINLRYLLFLLNSKLVNFYYVDAFGGNRLQGGYLRIGPPQIGTIPVKLPQPEIEREKAIHDEVVSLVDTMLALQQQSPAAKTEHARTLIERQIASTDAQIDALVYEIYSLTSEEIALVEAATATP